MIIYLQELTTPQRQNWLQTAIGPRPVCFASTIDKAGNVNLSPFSFFNLVSTNPPIIVFSPSRRVRDNSTKHTLQNLYEVPEVVVNIVDYEMVQQASLASCEYPKGISEFVKAGFTPVESQKIRPPRVKESKVQFEAKVLEIKPLGELGGAGNLVLCELLIMHLDERILNEEGTMIDQRRLHQIARLGLDWYCKVDEANLFRVPKPNVKLGVGFDALPETVRQSKVLTGNHLGQLANVHELPLVNPAFYDEQLKKIIEYFSINPDDLELELHRYVKELLEKGKVDEAWQVLLANEA
jgi:flavin reductase (DIM6/NTAB) family NADH-FMN oxidoreductase RutF